MTHTITITKVPNEISDEIEYTIGGTCEAGCQVWRTCDEQHAEAPYDTDSTVTLHGVEHIAAHWELPLEKWAIQTNDCGAEYCHDLTGDITEQTQPGTYNLTVDWDGDFWIAFIGARLAEGGR